MTEENSLPQEDRLKKESPFESFLKSKIRVILYLICFCFMCAAFVWLLPILWDDFNPNCERTPILQGYIFGLSAYILFDYIRRKIVGFNPSVVFRLVEIGSVFVIVFVVIFFEKWVHVPKVSCVIFGLIALEMRLVKNKAILLFCFLAAYFGIIYFAINGYFDTLGVRVCRADYYYDGIVEYN